MRAEGLLECRYTPACYLPALLTEATVKHQWNLALLTLTRGEFQKYRNRWENNRRWIAL